MAGSQNAAQSNLIPIVDDDDPFKRMNGVLDAIWQALTNRDPDAVAWDLNQGVTVQSQHIRFRSELLVFSVTAAAVVSIQVGTVTRSFATGGADTKIVPFIFVIERGTDVTFTSVPAGATGYLIGERE